jgi:putative DNA primase/helicase
LIVDAIDVGRWVRVPTTDHPRKRNGAYKFLGDVGWVQNHAVDMDVSTWRADREMPAADVRRIHEQAAEFDNKMQQGWLKAAQRAQAMVHAAKSAEHGYLSCKGFGDMRGLVMADGGLLVPMRHWRTNALAGAQVIRWLVDERRHEKKMLPGMRAKGAVLRLGSPQATRTWLVEGYATGLSVEAALRLLKLRDSVTVCFSAGNLVHVAQQLPIEVMVFADNDMSGAGERAAQSAVRPYCMSEVIGEDANDLHKRRGIFSLAAVMVEAMRTEMAA